MCQVCAQIWHVFELDVQTNQPPLVRERLDRAQLVRNVCLRKIGGTWMVTHEHLSVPINMETYQAALDLKP
ncbi:hypothetical protein D9M71_444580 [compost metagenome]